MSLDLPGVESQPVTTVAALIEDLRRGEKPRSTHRVGLEHEKLVYPLTGEAKPVAYEGPNGIGALLERLALGGGTPFREHPGAPAIALQRGSATISLEPGGQLELSGTAAVTARAAHAENLAHLEEVKAAASSLGLQVVAAVGYRPFGTVGEMPWMPKTRYQVMRKTLSPRGALAQDMMLMTATGQVSIDWESEADCARKMTLLARIAPVVVALYANSPLVRGEPSGMLSYRSHVWTAVDAARCGFFPAMIDGSFTYAAYVEWALDAPLLFLRRNERYLTPSITFRALMRDGFEGRSATLQDWQDHLSTLFPEVRLKHVMEVRSADCVDAKLTGALPAFIRGLAYDSAALEDATAWMAASFESHTLAMQTARREGLRDVALHSAARELVALSRAGLTRLDAEDAPLLDPLTERAESGRSPAEDVLALAAKGLRGTELLSALRI